MCIYGDDFCDTWPVFDGFTFSSGMLMGWGMACAAD